MPKRLLVTGASGFIGRHLVNYFATCGTHVRTLTRGGATIAGVEVVAGPDLNQPVDWQSFLTGVDAVVHLAGIAHADSVATSYDRVNHIATASLAADCAKTGIRLVFVSSTRAQAGGSCAHVLQESDPPTPTDDYGRSKLAAEQAIRSSNAPFVILRPALVYGPGVKGNLAALLRLVRLPVPLPFGELKNRRSLIGIENLISAVALALESEKMLGDTFLVSDPVHPTFAEIVAALRAGLGRSPRLFNLSPKLFSSSLTLIGQRNLWERIGGELVVDPSKLLSVGWQPLKATLDGLKAMAQATR